MSKTMRLFNFWRKDPACSHTADSGRLNTFEPYSDEKLGYCNNQTNSREGSGRLRPASHTTQNVQRRLSWVLLILAIAGLVAYHVPVGKLCKSTGSTTTAAPRPFVADSVPTTNPPQLDLRPNSWSIIVFNDTDCEAANKTDILTGTGPSKCIQLGDGEDTWSIHWSPDPKEDLKACYYQDGGCSGANTTVNRGGCASRGYVGSTVKVIGFFENC